jgi:DNA-binding transcriptional LysR family regulator
MTLQPTTSDATLHAASRQDSRSLAAFVAVAQELQFARAADRLYLDPSLLGKLIRQLERTHGQKLFNRSTRSVILTDAGRRLLPQARRAVAALGAVEAASVRRPTTPQSRPQTVVDLRGSATSGPA